MVLIRKKFCLIITISLILLTIVIIYSMKNDNIVNDELDENDQVIKLVEECGSGYI